MPNFSNKSKMMLEECHPDLQKVLNEAIKYIDFTIVEGARTEEQQLKYYMTGKSKTMNSKHLPEYIKEYKKEFLILQQLLIMIGMIEKNFVF